MEHEVAPRFDLFVAAVVSTSTTVFAGVGQGSAGNGVCGRYGLRSGVSLMGRWMVGERSWTGADG